MANAVIVAMAALTVLVAGCPTPPPMPGPVDSHPQPDFPLVAPETVEVAYDQKDIDDSTTLDDMVTLEQGLADQALLLMPMRNALLSANNLLKAGLIRLHQVVEGSDALAWDDDFGIWRMSGPRFVYTLLIERDAANRDLLHYQLLVRPVERPEVQGRALLSGFFLSEGVDETTGRQLGSGLLRYDYDAINLGQGRRIESGRGAVGFRVTRETRELNVFFVDFAPRGREENRPINGRFHFLERADGGGSFRFAGVGDFRSELQAREQWRQVVEWDSDRAGRTHVAITPSDRMEEFILEECWDPTLAQVWVTSDPVLPSFMPDGFETDCAIASQPELPMGGPIGPGEEPPIPGR